MKHVLGMAKANLDLVGAKADKLELDYLRLVYAVKELQRGGDRAQGYLTVLSAAIEKRTRSWRRKYAAGDTVVVMQAQINADELARRQAEVLANRRSMVAVVQGMGDGTGSDASFGRELAELALALLIGDREPGVVRVTDEAVFPNRVKWDFYGTRV